MIPTQDIVHITDTLETLSDELLSMTVTLIEAEQLKRANEAKELKDDEMDYEARMEAKELLNDESND